MKILFVLLAIAVALLFFYTESFTTECKGLGVPYNDPEQNGQVLRSYTKAECDQLGGNFSQGAFGQCIKPAGGSFSWDCRDETAAAPAPAAPGPAPGTIPVAPATAMGLPPVPSGPTPTGGDTTTSIPIPGVPPPTMPAAPVGMPTSMPVQGPPMPNQWMSALSQGKLHIQGQVQIE